MERSFSERVWQAVVGVPRGRVTTYERIARAVGSPNAARAVGSALSKNPYPAFLGGSQAKTTIPCHRVVRANGELGGYSGGARRKRQLLEHEGVHFVEDKVDAACIIFCPQYLVGLPRGYNTEDKNTIIYPVPSGAG
ncbi:MAG: MGMT family protein [Patescibacteria group bacterium]|jgi:O-6-methylguanine DNA methyltransferase